MDDVGWGVVGRSGELGGSCGVKSNAKLASSKSFGGANRTERDFVSRDEFSEFEAFGWGVWACRAVRKDSSGDSMGVWTEEFSSARAV